MATAGAAALGIAVSPIPVLAVAALLGSHTVRTAFAFVAGEAVAVGAVAALVVAASAGSLGDSLHSTLSFMQLAIAALLVLLWIAHRRRSRDDAAAGRVLARLDETGVRPSAAFATGAALVALNPKNFALALAGGAAILDLDTGWSVNVLTVLAFTALAISVLTAEVVAYALWPRRAASLLARGREAAMRHERVVVTVVLLGLALLFFMLGLRGLLR